MSERLYTLDEVMESLNKSWGNQMTNHDCSVAKRLRELLEVGETTDNDDPPPGQGMNTSE